MHKQSLDNLVRSFHQETVARCEPLNVFLIEPLERGEIVRHVAIGRIDHDGRALHDVVAGEQQVLLFEQEAELVRCVARRVQHAQGRTGNFKTSAFNQFMIRHESLILPLFVRGKHSISGGLRVFLE